MSVQLADYPQLRLLAWNRAPDALLSDEEAFGLYEREWRWVEQAALCERERALIARLTEACGGGVMNV